MILIDYSSIIHRKIYSSITSMKPKKVNGKYITSEFIDFTKYQIIQELFSIEREFSSKYGNLVICLDNKSPEGYWRNDFLKSYKCGRSKARIESDIDFETVWPEIHSLTDCILKNLPWRTIEIHRAEADDLILVLAEEFIKFNPILDYTKSLTLIHSPDKDMIQSQYGNNVIDQYSALTNKWLTPDTKSESMEDWLLEHVCLGDVADSVPKIVQDTEFSESFIEYLKDNNVDELEPLKFRNSSLSVQEKVNLIQNFDVYKYNRAGEQLEKDVYRTIRFGPSNLAKEIKKFGSLDSYLDSNPLYRENYERNKILVLTEGIPDYIRENILKGFKDASVEYSHKEFEKYLNENNLSSLLLELPASFSSKRGEISAEDFW